MTDVLTALHNFWSGFGVSAYLHDQVPDDATLPYITYEAVHGDFFDVVTTSAHYWTTSGVSAFATFLNSVKAAIPHSGKCLKTDTGAILLYPGSGDFLSIHEEQDSDGKMTGVKGARVGYEVQFYCT